MQVQQIDWKDYTTYRMSKLMKHPIVSLRYILINVVKNTLDKHLLQEYNVN